MAPPSARLAALLQRRPGASLDVPRRLLADVVAEATRATGDREAAVRFEALAQAVDHREASLARVAPERVQVYLIKKGWEFRQADEDFAVYAVGAVLVDAPLHSRWRDYPRRLWEVAEAVGVIERRHPTRVLADWLVPA